MNSPPTKVKAEDAGEQHGGSSDPDDAIGGATCEEAFRSGVRRKPPSQV